MCWLGNAGCGVGWFMSAPALMRLGPMLVEAVSAKLSVATPRATSAEPMARIAPAAIRLNQMVLVVVMVMSYLYSVLSPVCRR